MDNNLVTFKVTHAGLTRRLTLPPSQLKWREVISKIAAMFGRDPASLNALVYVDEDGDRITIDTDQELHALWVDATLHGKPMPRLLLPTASADSADTRDWVMAHAAEPTASSSSAEASPATSERVANLVLATKPPSTKTDTPSVNERSVLLGDTSSAANAANESATPAPVLSESSTTTRSVTSAETTAAAAPLSPPPPPPLFGVPPTTNTQAPSDVPSVNVVASAVPPSEASVFPSGPTSTNQSFVSASSASSHPPPSSSSSDVSDTDTIDPAEHEPPALGAQIRDLACEFVDNIRSDTALANNARQVADQTLCLVQQSMVFAMDALRTEIVRASDPTRPANRHYQARARGTQTNSSSGADTRSAGSRAHSNLNETLATLADNAIAMAHNLQRHAIEFTRTAQRGMDLLNERAQTRGTSIAHSTHEQAIHLARLAQQQASIVAEQAMHHLNRLQRNMTSNQADAPEPGYRHPSPTAANIPLDLPTPQTPLNVPPNLPTSQDPPNVPPNLLAPEDRQYAKELEQLKEMGYTNDEHLLCTLRVFRGDLVRVVEALSVEENFVFNDDDDDFYS